MTNRFGTCFKNTLTMAATVAAMTSGMQAHAAFVNGGFESGNLSGWSTSGNVIASGTQNYGAPGSVVPFDTTAAKVRTEGVTAGTLASIMGITETALEASNDGVNATDGAMIYQSTAAVAGDTFKFKWNFVEQDYVPFDDWAFYGISLNGGPASVTKFASLATVGPDGNTTVNGWDELIVNITQTGNYTFYFGIVNALDTALDSDLWIDGVGGTGTLSNDVPEPGSLALLGLGLAGLAAARRRKQV